MKHSIGEQLVSKVLKEHGVDFRYDVSIDDLKGVRNGILRFDFVIFDKGLKLVLEYNGIFHYHVVQGKTNMYTLSKQQMNDVIKQDYCRRNNIPILWVPYWMNTRQIRSSIRTFLIKYRVIV